MNYELLTVDEDGEIVTVIPEAPCDGLPLSDAQRAYLSAFEEYVAAEASDEARSFWRKDPLLAVMLVEAEPNRDARKAGRLSPVESFRCLSCTEVWHRDRTTGPKPRTCPDCR